MKTTHLFSITLLLINFSLSAQNIGINGTGANAHPSALLDIDAASTPSLGILIPRISLTAINVAAPVSSPATSLLVYNTATASSGTTAVSPGYYYWDGSKWVRFQYASSGTSSLDWSLTGNAGTIAGANFLGTTDDIDLVFKRNGIQAGLLNNSLSNTAFGVFALSSGTLTGGGNTAIGYRALKANTSGFTSTGVGQDALYSQTSAFENTAIGYASMYNTTTGSQNTALGRASLGANTIGNRNTTSGDESMSFNISGSDNSAFGLAALKYNSTGINNTAIGAQSSFSNTTGSDNVAVGFKSSYNNTTGSSNVAVGSNALFSNTTGSVNVAVGPSALYNNTAGYDNIAIGYQPLLNNTGNDNIAIGQSSLYSNSGYGNSALGYQSMLSNTSGFLNVAMGYNSLLNNTTGNSNTGIGFAASQTNFIGSNNVAVGSYALQSNTAGGNTALGSFALNSSSTGLNNSASGAFSNYRNTTGSNNTSMGVGSLDHNTTGNGNTAIGVLAGTTNTFGINNTYIGYLADATANSFNNATAIGYNAKVGQSNAMILGGTGVDAVNVGIGTSNPGAKTHIISNSSLTADAIVMISRGIATSDGWLRFHSGATIGDWNGLVRTGDKSIIYTNDSDPNIDDNSGLLIGPWTGSVNPTGGQKGLKIMENGNVGIGTPTPNTKLHIVATATNTGFQLQDGTEGANKVLMSDATGKASWKNIAAGWAAYARDVTITSAVPSGTNVVLGASSFINGTGGSFNLTAGQIYVPYAGTYRIIIYFDFFNGTALSGGCTDISLQGFNSSNVNIIGNCDDVGAHDANRKNGYMQAVWDLPAGGYIQAKSGNELAEGVISVELIR